MTDLEKIHEEIRNYKLFKIQRLDTKAQQFEEIRRELISIRKNSLTSFILIILCVVSLCGAVYFLHNESGKELSTILIVFSAIMGLFVFFISLDVRTKLKKYISIMRGAVQHFETESMGLKNMYESYINDYLEGLKRNKGRN